MDLVTRGGVDHLPMWVVWGATPSKHQEHRWGPGQLDVQRSVPHSLAPHPLEFWREVDSRQNLNLQVSSLVPLHTMSRAQSLTLGTPGVLLYPQWMRPGGPACCRPACAHLSPSSGYQHHGQQSGPANLSSTPFSTSWVVGGTVLGLPVP